MKSVFPGLPPSGSGKIFLYCYIPSGIPTLLLSQLQPSGLSEFLMLRKRCSANSEASSRHARPICNTVGKLIIPNQRSLLLIIRPQDLKLSLDQSLHLLKVSWGPPQAPTTDTGRCSFSTKNSSLKLRRFLPLHPGNSSYKCLVTG